MKGLIRDGGIEYPRYQGLPARSRELRPKYQALSGCAKTPVSI